MEVDLNKIFNGSKHIKRTELIAHLINEGLEEKDAIYKVNKLEGDGYIKLHIPDSKQVSQHDLYIEKLR